MVTNAIRPLAPGEGNYNFFLNAQGRIQGDGLIFREPALRGPAVPEAADPGPGGAEVPSYLIATGGDQVDFLQGHLDRFIIMDDVELTPAFPEQGSLSLAGPEAPAHLAHLHLPALDPLHLAYADTPHGAVLLLTPPPTLLPHFEVRAPVAVVQALAEELRQASVAEISPETLEGMRLVEGIPRFGTDIRDRDLAQETGQTHALHFAKGCYLGQEIVERIRSRGQVHRLLTSFRLEGSLPVLPAPLEADGKAAGELTSAAEVALADGPVLLALGYCRREALDRHAVLLYPGGRAHPRALP